MVTFRVTGPSGQSWIERCPSSIPFLQYANGIPTGMGWSFVIVSYNE